MKIKYPIIVEGKYDKIKITSLFEATVITTDGFENASRRYTYADIKSKIKRQTERYGWEFYCMVEEDGGGECRMYRKMQNAEC